MAINRVVHGVRTCLPVLFVSRVKSQLEGLKGDRRVLHGVGVSTHDDVDEAGAKNQMELSATVHLLYLADSAAAAIASSCVKL